MFLLHVTFISHSILFKNSISHVKLEDIRIAKNLYLRKDNSNVDLFL